MRDIKFRGKRVDDGEWVYWDLYGEFVEPFPPYYDIRLSVCYLDIIPETVGQYTGLKDMKGVEIYEGDNLEGLVYSQRYIYSIGFNSKCSMFCFGYYMQKEFEFLYDEATEYCLDNLKLNKMQVIGNIHDNV
jgi:hypothetical protein